MDVQLRTKGQVEVYDIITTFAVSTTCRRFAEMLSTQLNENYIDAKSIEDQFKLKPGASRNLFINGNSIWSMDKGGKTD